MISTENKTKRKLLSSPLWGIGGLVLFVLLIRYFLVGSYRISTHSMEDALHKGDFILVNKLPVRSPLPRNQVILFTSPLQQDKHKAPLILSRCVALPGDTIHVSKEGYRVGGVMYPRSPHSLATYVIDREMADAFQQTLKKLSIPLRDIREGRQTISVSLTPFEEYQIREEMSERMNKRFIPEETESYTLVVPKKGGRYRLTESFLTASREAIAAEAAGKVTFRDRKLQIDGKNIAAFRFSRDYYWVLSDNVNEAVDSRHLGFIPADHIVGKAWFCWFSKDKQRRFKRIN